MPHSSGTRSLKEYCQQTTHLVEPDAGAQRHKEALHGELVDVRGGQVRDEPVVVVHAEPPQVVGDTHTTRPYVFWAGAGLGERKHSSEPSARWLLLRSQDKD